MFAGRSKLFCCGYSNILQKYAAYGENVFGSIKYRRHSMKFNTGIVFVPDQEAWVVERLGKFHKVLSPGLNILIPILDKIKYVQSLKEIALEIPDQSAITADNVTLDLNAVLYLKVLDPYLASYGVEDPEYAVTLLAQTSLRSELGKISVDKIVVERENLSVAVVNSINKASASWGLSCLRCGIGNIGIPQAVKEAMELQVEAERKKRAAILESEGIRKADINVAEGKREARILASEAEKMEQINKAEGEASALLAVAQARAKELEIIADSLKCSDSKNAASFNVALKYVSAFNQLAQKGNTLILPSNVSDVSQMVTQALAIYQKISQVERAECMENYDNKENQLENN